MGASEGGGGEASSSGVEDLPGSETSEVGTVQAMSLTVNNATVHNINNQFCCGNQVNAHDCGNVCVHPVEWMGQFDCTDRGG